MSHAARDRADITVSAVCPSASARATRSGLSLALSERSSKRRLAATSGLFSPMRIDSASSYLSTKAFALS